MKFQECFSFAVLTCIISGAPCGSDEVLAEAGSQTLLPCKNRHIRHNNAKITWTKDTNGTVWRMEPSGLQYRGSRWSNPWNQRVQSPHTQFRNGDYSLQIDRVTEEDGGLYTCRVVARDHQTECKVMLRIIRVAVSPSRPIMGKDVSVTCRVTPRPARASVQWMFNDSPFVAPRGGRSREDVSFVEEKATMSSSGKWTCVVKRDGKEGRASASLSVRGIVQPFRDDSKLYAAEGSAATLPCVFSSGLKPLNSTWEKLQPGSSPTPVLGHIPSSLTVSSTAAQPPWDKSATLDEVGVEHRGTYRCAGSAEGRRMARTMQLVVAKIVVSSKGSSVTLTCSLSDADEVTRYEWVPVVNGTESEGPLLEGKTVSLGGASETFDQWTCRFYGATGFLGNVTHHIVQMSNSLGRKSAAKPGNTAAIIGLSFLLLVLLVILVQIYKNHRRRKGIFQYPALETIVHTVSNEREKRERNPAKK